MTWQPDRALILSLPDATERREHMRAMIPRLGFAPEIMDAVDGTATPVPDDWEASPQAWGNAQSHRAALSGATGSVLVLEDDAFIPGDFQARLAPVLQQDDWQLIMLGGELYGPYAYVAPGVIRVTQAYRSIGYIARDQAIPATLDAINRSRTHWDFEWMRTMRSLNVYAPAPFLVLPADHESTIPDSTPYASSRRTRRN